MLYYSSIVCLTSGSIILFRYCVPHIMLGVILF